MVKIKHLKAMKSADKYVNYLAKRDGVDKTINQRVLIGKPTQKQIEFIDYLILQQSRILKVLLLKRNQACITPEREQRIGLKSRICLMMIL